MTRPARPAHHTLNPFPVIDDCLQPGGVALTRLAERVGTPFYAYDRNLISARIAALRHALPPQVQVHYALKANPMPELVQHVAGLVDGLDVASAGELALALRTAVPREQISFAGPGKTDEELRHAIEAGIVVHLESETEMRRLAQLGASLGQRPRVAVRVNPDFELKSSGLKMGGGPRPFGVDAERVPAMLMQLGELALEFVGFHIFAGSQNLRAEAIVEAQNKTLDLALQLAAHAPAPVQWLNIGGGFGIPYFPGDMPLDIAPIARNLAQHLPELQRRLPEAKLVLELGRYLVGEAGIYVCRVIDRKISRGQVFLITDGGLHQHLAASGNFGQVVRKNYPVLIGNKVLGTEREVVNVVGPLCTPLDILADQMEMARADVGDLVVVLQSGAYGLTASPLEFLSHPHPAEMLV